MYGPWGGMPMYGQPIILNGNGNPNELAEQLRSVAKALNRSHHKHEEKKNKKVSAPSLSLGQAWAITFAMAIPVALFQGYMLTLLRTFLTTAINGSPQ